MIRVYIAAPLGGMEGRDARVNAAIEAGEDLIAAGFLPFVPHLFARWDSYSAHRYEFWMGMCIAWLGQCQALYRLPGHSPGADREVAWCEAHGVPVFRSVQELIAW